MSTGYVYDPLYLEHNRVGHVECRERLETTMQVLREQRLLDRLVEIQPTQVPMDHLLEVHHEHYVKLVREVSERGGGHLDPDTYVNERSFDVALLAAGGLLNLVEAIMNGEVANGFALVRPPGHHALRGRGMGFCLFNNIAVATAYALQRRGLSRVLIVDFDLHHGNGTQEIFWSDKTVLYASTHQMPLFPGTGAPSETGVGNIFNAPLSPGDGSAEFKAAFREVILPAVRAFKPELVLISAGFDAHKRDPLAEINLEAEDFAWATDELLEIADETAGGRVVAMLEGGYDLKGLAASAAAHIRQLMAA